jgi:hypothetical protein
MELEMPKSANSDAKPPVRLAPRPQPKARQILHQKVPTAPLVRPNAPGAPKQADQLKSDPTGGIDPRQMHN